ncbi:MAG: 50S ribosomal protein L18 [Patescibacteria group bacterium]|nr:50S ribosomal protein L18 [Patescibacteria group bacterium]MDE2437823.1 50S ribosomal protein L18 [Patescibacteria group bacterium]
MTKKNITKKLRAKRHHKIRMSVVGTAKRPRLAIFKSSQHVYAQVINDEKGTTLAAASDLELKKSKKTKTERASEVGALIASRALEAKLNNVVFDRGGFSYVGRVKALADAARERGLQF